MNRFYYITVMQNTHGSEIFPAEEFRKFEKLNFLKKSSYLFMQKAGYQVFKFVTDKFNKGITLNSSGSIIATANLALHKEVMKILTND